MDGTSDEQAFLEELFGHGLLISTGIAGLYGRSAVFERILDGVDGLVSRAAAGDGAEAIRFPPTINRHHFETSEFLNSFPQLAGSVFSFDGSHAEHLRLIELSHAHQDWSGLQQMTDLVLTPAACYPIYPMVASRGPLPEGGRLFDVFSYCFRHEPSPDPARMQMFRMREFVRVCQEDAAVPWRDLWRRRTLELLGGLGLPVSDDVANDPFFGRGGRLLAVNQRDQRLKFEVLMPICSTERPTAIASFNYHQDHFGSLFGIQTAGGETAHTACMGWGLERITLGLIKTHGPDPQGWPARVREQLWP